MKVLLCEEPGRFAYIKRDEPLMQEERAILKVKRIGICGTDLHAFEGTQPYFEYPRVLGHELACEIIDIRVNDEFKAGDKVTFIPYFNCGECIACRNGLTNCCVNMKVFGVHIDGGMSEYISVPINKLLHGNKMSFDELALVEPLAIGAHGVRRAAVKPGEFVLIVGAGPIGLAQDGVELGKCRSHDVGRCGCARRVRGVDADVADADPLRTQPARRALDRLPDRGDGVRAADQRLGVLDDRLGETDVIAVPIAEFAVESEPAGTLGPGSELAEQDGLARASQTGKRPVRMEWGSLKQPVLERAQHVIPARQVWRWHAVARPERVRQRIRLSGECRASHRSVSCD